MNRKFSRLGLIAGLVLVIGSGIAHSTQVVVSGPDTSFLETPALVQVNFTIINTGPTAVTIGVTAATFSPVGGDTALDAIDNIFARAACDGVKLGILAADNSCVFGVQFNVLDHDPGDVFNKIDDIGKWFIEVTVPYTGGVDAGPAVGGANIKIVDCGTPGSGPTCSPTPEPGTLPLASSALALTALGLRWIVRIIPRPR